VTTHHLKCWPASFQAVVLGEKRAEFRFDDRKFQAGDVVILNEYEPTAHKYTGRSHTALITDVQRGPDWGIPVDYAMLSIVAADKQY
jgi:hypothetical protein